MGQRRDRIRASRARGWGCSDEVQGRAGIKDMYPKGDQGTYMCTWYKSKAI